MRMTKSHAPSNRGFRFSRYSQALAPFYFFTNLIWVIPMLFWWEKIKRAPIEQAPA